MHQSKLESLIETFVNVSSGIIVAMLVTEFMVIPLWDLDWSLGDNLAITLAFTSVSILRGYFWRRFFNAGIHRVIHSCVRRAFK